MQQQTKEWHEWRKQHIGASDAPIIMGVSPWKTPYQLWQEKLGYVENNYKSSAMQYGIDNEEAARRAFEEYMDVEVFPMCLESKKYPFIAASLDGLSFEKDLCVEIKCPKKDDHVLAKNGEVPPKYYPQLQHQLFVTELSEVYYFSYHNNEGVFVKVERDDEYIEKMVEKECKFYDLLVKKTPPELTERDYDKRDDNEWLQTEKKWLESRNRLKEAEQEEKQFREELLSLTDKNAVGQAAKATKFIAQGRVNYNKIPELIGVDLDAYRSKPQERWRITPL